MDPEKPESAAGSVPSVNLLADARGIANHLGSLIRPGDIENRIVALLEKVRDEQREQIRKWLLWNAPSPDHKSPREALEWAAANMEKAELVNEAVELGIREGKA